MKANHSEEKRDHEDHLVMAQEFLDWTSQKPAERQVSSRSALSELFSAFCREGNRPARSFGQVLFRMKEAGRLRVVRGESIVWSGSQENGRKHEANGRKSDSHGRRSDSNGRKRENMSSHEVLEGVMEILRNSDGYVHVSDLTRLFAKNHGVTLKMSVQRGSLRHYFATLDGVVVMEETDGAKQYFVGLESKVTDTARPDEEAIIPPFVCTQEDCAAACRLLSDETQFAVIVKCHSSGDLVLLQVASASHVFVFDLMQESLFGAGLADFLRNPKNCFMAFGADWLRKRLRHHVKLSNLLEVKHLFAAANKGRPPADLAEVFMQLESEFQYRKLPLKSFSTRPLPKESKDMAVCEATALFDAASKFVETLGSKTVSDIRDGTSKLPVPESPQRKVDSPKKSVEKPVENGEIKKKTKTPLQRVVSSPLPSRNVTAEDAVQKKAPTSDHSSPRPAASVSSPIRSPSMNSPQPRIVHAPRPVVDLSSVLAVLPPAIAQQLPDRMPDAATSLLAIAIDLGQPVTLQRLYREPPVRLLKLDCVTSDDLRFMRETLGPQLTQRGSCAVGSSLHTAHALRDGPSGDLVGVTIKIARTFPGISDIFHDLIQRPASLLFLGFGKTTMIRDIVSKGLVSQYRSVMLIDTRGDVGGLCLNPNPSLGVVRRTIPAKDHQAQAIQGAIANHACDLLAVDEVWKPEELAELRLARLKNIQVIAGHPASSFAQLRGVAPPDLFRLFDYVVENRSPVAYQIHNLRSDTIQERLRTMQGIAMSEERPFPIIEQ